MATHQVAQPVPQRFRRGKVVYFIGSDDGPVKIGYTGDIGARLRSLQNSSPVPVRLLATRTGGIELEREYHARFREHRLHGEWFAMADEILDEIGRLRWTVPLVENIQRFARMRRMRPQAVSLPVLPLGDG